MQNFEAGGRLPQLDQELLYRCVEGYFAARDRGELGRFRDFLAPDFDHEIVGPIGPYPCFGPGRGLESYQWRIGYFNSTYERLKPRILEMKVFANDVVLKKTVFARNWGTGRSVWLEACVWLKFHDGLITHYTEYVDTDSLVRVLQG